MNTKSERDTNPLPYLSALPEAIAATRKQVQADLQALAATQGDAPVRLNSAFLQIGLGAATQLLMAQGQDGALLYATPLATDACVEDLRKWMEPQKVSFAAAVAGHLTSIQITRSFDGLRRWFDVIGANNQIRAGEGQGLTQALLLAWHLLSTWPEATDFNAIVVAVTDGKEDTDRTAFVYLDGREEDGEWVFFKVCMIVRPEYADAALVYLEHLLRQDVRCIGYTDIFRDHTTKEERDKALQPVYAAEDVLGDAINPFSRDQDIGRTVTGSDREDGVRLGMYRYTAPEKRPNAPRSGLGIGG